MAILQCGLQITGETLSALALKQVKGTWTVAGGAMTQVSTDSTELAGPLKALARQIKAGPSPFAVALPKQQAIMRNVSLPSTEAAELVQMARFEIERHIPFHAERYASGYHVMRKMGVEGSEVLLAAIDGPIVQRAVDAFQEAGLNPRGMTLSSVALCNAALFSRRDWLLGKTVALLSIGLDTLDLVLLTDGRVLFARSVSIDLRSVLEAKLGWDGSDAKTRPELARLAHVARMTDCAKLQTQAAGATPEEDNSLLAGWLSRVIQEIRRTYDFARREMKCPPIEALLMTGEGALLNNIDEYFRAAIDAEVVLLNPIAALPGTADHKFPFEGYEFAVAFGAAIADSLEGAYRIDLTPTEYYRTQTRRRTKQKLMVTGTILLLTLILGGAKYYQFSTHRARALEEYTAMLARVKPTAGQLKEKKNKLDIIHRYLNDPNNAMVVLSSIGGSKSVHNTVSIRSIAYTMNDSITITGHAKTPPDLDAYTGDLKRSNHAEVWELQGREPTKVNGRDAYNFTLNGSISKNEGEGRNATP